MNVDMFALVFSITMVYLSIFFPTACFWLCPSSFLLSHSSSIILNCMYYIYFVSSYPFNFLCPSSHPQTYIHAPFSAIFILSSQVHMLPVSRSTINRVNSQTCLGFLSPAIELSPLKLSLFKSKKTIRNIRSWLKLRSKQGLTSRVHFLF